MPPAPRFKPYILPPLLALLALGACTSTQPPAPPLPPLKTTVTLTPGDIAFAQKLNAMNSVQAATAKSAKTNAGRSDIATLAATIAQDSTAQQAALAKLVAPHAIALPTAPSKEGQQTINRLKNLHGPAFDRQYIRALTQETARIKPTLDAEILTSSNADMVKLAKDTSARLAAYQAQIQ